MFLHIFVIILNELKTDSIHQHEHNSCVTLFFIVNNMNSGSSSIFSIIHKVFPLMWWGKGGGHWLPPGLMLLAITGGNFYQQPAEIELFIDFLCECLPARFLGESLPLLHFVSFQALHLLGKVLLFINRIFLFYALKNIYFR